jgi:hypothetical protein
MKNLYGTIGYTVLSNGQTNNKIIVFADKHDKLPGCDNKTNIAQWFKEKMHSSKILLEEVPRDSVELAELWSDSVHTQDLKNLYLENAKKINGLDIRPLLIPFSWEIENISEPAHNITVKKYLEKIDMFFTLKTNYLLENLPNYNLNKLLGTKLGEHFLLLKKNFKKILETNREFLYFTINTVKKINLDFLQLINSLLDQIMEWNICANIMANNEKSIIVHAGLAHSEKIIQLLQFHYQYNKINETGINNLDLINDSNMSGCIIMPADTDSQFGGSDT